MATQPEVCNGGIVYNGRKIFYGIILAFLIIDFRNSFISYSVFKIESNLIK